MNSKLKKLFMIIGLIEFEGKLYPSFYIKAMINKLSQSTLPGSYEKMMKLRQALKSN